MTPGERVAVAAVAGAGAAWAATVAWGWRYRHVHRCPAHECARLAICTDRTCGPLKVVWCPDHEVGCRWCMHPGEQPCPRCDGAGYTYRSPDEAACAACDATGWVDCGCEDPFSQGGWA